MASVARVCAKAASRSLSGMREARPGMRVSTTLCATSGTVSSRPSAADGGGERGHTGRERIGNCAPLEPAQLLGQRAVDGEVAGMKPRHIEPASCAFTNSASI